MKLQNVRLGFATNSSSSHSVLVFKNREDIPATTRDDDSSYFGWESFILSDPTMKMHYYNAQHLGNVDSGGSSDWRDGRLSIADRLTGEDATLDIMLNNNVAVLGGNDNSTDDYLESIAEKGIKINGNYYPPFTTFLSDPKGHYVLFDKKSGNKVRFGDSTPTKSTWPELVDVKITDYCPYGCKYCYQGSTVKGQHADTQYLYNLANKFKDSGVFECAIGGGEPTLHPDFRAIVEAFVSAGVNVNVTSRNIPFWEDQINQSIPISAIAFSVDKAEEITEIRKKFTGKNIPFEIHFQVVVGTTTDKELARIFEAVGPLRLTLLGYKDTGRGKKARKNLPILSTPDQTGWIEIWRAENKKRKELKEVITQHWDTYFKSRTLQNEFLSVYKYIDSLGLNSEDFEKEICLAIDSTLASRSRDELKKTEVSSLTYHIEEGAFSAYIDAVAKQMGPSSYVPHLMKDFDVADIWDAYAAVQVIDAGDF